LEEGPASAPPEKIQVPRQSGGGYLSGTDSPPDILGIRPAA